MKSIKQIAEDFDLAIEQRNIPRILEFFLEDCEIELLGVHLNGKEGAVI